MEGRSKVLRKTVDRLHPAVAMKLIIVTSQDEFVFRNCRGRDPPLQRIVRCAGLCAQAWNSFRTEEGGAVIDASPSVGGVAAECGLTDQPKGFMRCPPVVGLSTLPPCQWLISRWLANWQALAPCLRPFLGKRLARKPVAPAAPAERFTSTATHTRLSGWSRSSPAGLHSDARFVIRRSVDTVRSACAGGGRCALRRATEALQHMAEQAT
jgi:hypothetical protein